MSEKLWSECLERTVYVFFQNLHVDILPSKDDGIKSQAESTRGWSPMNGIKSPIKEPLRHSSLSPSRAQGEDAVNQEAGSAPGRDLWYPELGTSCSRTGGNKCLLFISSRVVQHLLQKA